MKNGLLITALIGWVRIIEHLGWLSKQTRRLLTVDRFRTPLNRKADFLAMCVMPLLAALGLAASFTQSAFAQGFARPDGSIPVPIDWSSSHVIFTGGYTPEQAVNTWNEPRAYAQWLLHGNAPRRFRPVAVASNAAGPGGGGQEAT